MNQNGSPLNQRKEEEAKRIAWLIAGYLQQTLSEKEHDELDEWITASDANQELFEELTEPAVIEKGLKEMDEIDSEAALERIKSKIVFAPKTKTAKSGRIRRLAYTVAAASVVLLVGTFLIYIVNRETADGRRETSDVSRELKPGGDKATLTIEDGSVIDISNLPNGEKVFSHVKVGLANGLIEYGAEVTEEPSSAFHTLSTPVGGQYQIVLPDGTRVWLNSSSKLRYPVVFNDKERVVELEGEGYFEVKPPSPKGGSGRVPFIVKVNGMEVEVLGTHFNVNAYDSVREVVLLEGAVSVKQNAESKMLKPGQQLQVVSGEWRVTSGVDTSLTVAWKNGKFQFKNARIETVMQQVARWYGAEVVYEGKTPDHHFNATIYRSEPVSKLLSLLEETGRVHFSIEGRRVVVRG